MLPFRQYFPACKNPSDADDWYFDFSADLNISPPDTIASATVVALPDDLLISSVSPETTMVALTLTAGQDQQDYAITATIVTVAGKTFSRTRYLSVSALT